MNDFFEKPFAKFLRILVASLFVSFILFIFLQNAFESIWAGCFILIYYYMRENSNNTEKEINEDNKNFFFTNKFINTTGFSLAILLFTTLLAGLIYAYLISSKICIKGSFFYSEKQCAIQHVDNQYSQDDYSADNN